MYEELSVFVTKADECLGAGGTLVEAAKHLSRQRFLSWFEEYAEVEKRARMLWTYWNADSCRAARRRRPAASLRVTHKLTSEQRVHASRLSRGFRSTACCS